MTLHDKQMKVLSHYGITHQMRKLLEEIDELAFELKVHDDESVSYNTASFCHELADAANMIDQMKSNFGKDYIESIQNDKMDRQLERIEHVQTKNND